MQMHNSQTRGRIKRELQHAAKQMNCCSFTLYKQDASAGYTPVMSSATQSGAQPPYISAASDITAYLRTNSTAAFTMQANTFRDQLARKGISAFGINELLVCPLNVTTQNDFILTFGSAKHFDDQLKQIAQAVSKTITPMLAEFIASVEHKMNTLDVPAEFSVISTHEAETFKMLQDVLTLDSYAYLIRIIQKRLPLAGGIVIENRLGHAVASSESETMSLKNRLTPLTYLVLLDAVQKQNSPLIISGSMFTSDVESVTSAPPHQVKNNTQAQCLVVPLSGGDEFIGFLTIFEISRTYISENISFIAAISFAATYLLRSHEASRSQTLRRILSSIENERRSVSIDLHDETSQNLVALGVRLSTAQRALEMQRTDEARSILEDCLCITDNILTEVNRLSSELRSSELTYLGLRAAIEAEANHRLPKAGISYTLTGNALDRHFDAFQETMLLKGVIEALSNCARHAQATEVVISLDDDNTWFSIQISDNGIGFDDVVMSSWDIPNNYGMKTMHDCADSLGGIFWIGSYPGDGTTVRFSVPNRLLEDVSYE
jgi:signal transduction histidine kinase